MTIEEKAEIVALARLAGVTGDDSEILDKYCEYYQKTFESLKAKVPNPTVKVIDRSFF